MLDQKRIEFITAQIREHLPNATLRAAFEWNSTKISFSEELTEKGFMYITKVHLRRIFALGALGPEEVCEVRMPTQTFNFNDPLLLLTCIGMIRERIAADLAFPPWYEEDRGLVLPKEPPIMVKTARSSLMRVIRFVKRAL